jgi:YHS domain-containing protein
MAVTAARAEHRDPVCGADLGPAGSVHTLEHRGATYEFCSARCKEAFRARPHAYVREGLLGRLAGLWSTLSRDSGGGGRCC